MKIPCMKRHIFVLVEELPCYIKLKIHLIHCAISRLAILCLYKGAGKGISIPQLFVPDICYSKIIFNTFEYGSSFSLKLNLNSLENISFGENVQDFSFC